MTDQALDLAVVTFPHIEGAEHAYADALDHVGQAPWTREITFVEHHGRDRIVVRGTFAGRYVNTADEGDVIGRRTAEGALTGAVVGALFGPAGFAAGLVAGGTIGGTEQAAADIPQLRGAFFDEIRADVPEGSSALMLLASPEHADAMVAAFGASQGELVRHHLTAEQATALEQAVADSPDAATGSDAV
jgi:uncharacterized membrane protein